jgi:hypothetical protein
MSLTLDDLRLLQDILTTDWIIEKMESSPVWNPRLKTIGEVYTKLIHMEDDLLLESMIIRFTTEICKVIDMPHRSGVCSKCVLDKVTCGKRLELPIDSEKPIFNYYDLVEFKTLLEDPVNIIVRKLWDVPELDIEIFLLVVNAYIASSHINKHTDLARLVTIWSFMKRLHIAGGFCVLVSGSQNHGNCEDCSYSIDNGVWANRGCSAGSTLLTSYPIDGRKRGIYQHDLRAFRKYLESSTIDVKNIAAILCSERGNDDAKLLKLVVKCLRSRKMAGPKQMVFRIERKAVWS